MSRHTTESIPTLAFALEQCLTVSELKERIAHTDQKAGTRKADLVAAILRHLEGDGLRHAWERLDVTQRTAVAEVVHSPSPYFSTTRFEAKYGHSPNWGETDRYGYCRKPSALCLFFYGHRAMPDDIKERLRVFVPVPAEAQVATINAPPASFDFTRSTYQASTHSMVQEAEAVPVVVREREHGAQRELMSLLRLVDAGKVKVSAKTYRPSAAAVAAIEGVLDGEPYYPDRTKGETWEQPPPGPIRGFAWPLLLQAGKLAKISGAQLQLTPAGRRALAAPAAPTLKMLWNKWIDNKLIDELSRIECVKGQTGKGKRGLTSPKGRRAMIDDFLSECPVGEWIQTKELLRHLAASDHAFAVSDNPWMLYIDHAEYGSLGYAGGSEMLTESYLLAVLLEYASTLGMIDVALLPPEVSDVNRHSLWGTDNLTCVSRYDGLLCLRITPLGAWILDQAESYEPTKSERKPTFRVLPNLEVTALAATVEPADEMALDSYAARVSPRVWQLQHGKLLAAMDDGHSLDAIREFLEARTNAPLPETTQRLFQDIAERQGRVRDCGTARLIECHDAALAALIANHTSTGKLCLAAGERHLAVPTDSEAAFRRALRKLGYLLSSGGKLN